MGEKEEKAEEDEEEVKEKEESGNSSGSDLRADISSETISEPALLPPDRLHRCHCANQRRNNQEINQSKTKIPSEFVQH